MSTITLAGNVKSALTYFALLGVSRILENQYPGKVLLWWSDEAIPRAKVSVEGANITDLAVLFQKIASEWAEAESWAQSSRQIYYGTKMTEASPFAPRVKPFDVEKNPDEWPQHQEARHRILNQLIVDSDWLSLELIAALGEPAYWRFDNRDPRPDHGASRWEMKTRNRGEEFITHRFGPMSKIIAEWPVGKIAAGLTGEEVNDPLGKNSSTSRTSTGLTPPGPTDVALAFAGIIGISMFPMKRKTHRMNVTPGAFPTTRLHPNLMILPIPASPITPARMSGLIESEALATVTQDRGRNSTGTSPTTGNFELGQATRWLIARQVPAVAVFPILLGGSSSAPERQVQDGEVYVL